MTHILALFARLTLGSMWIAAGAAKLAAADQNRRSVEEFGVARGRTAQFLGAALPLVEITLGILLLAGVSVRVVTTVSALFLTTFAVLMVVSLRQGKRVHCNCFGQLGAGTVSWGSVGRNIALLGVSLLPLFAPSDYLTLDRLIYGNSLSLGEPPLADLLPLLLTWIAMALAVVLLTAVWGTVANMARTEGGPADELPETHLVRRLMRIEPASPTVGYSRGD
jgi:uncharacterized membrane protein YphA (DoxX/SURF4 family)